jgi:hypothetical protein
MPMADDDIIAAARRTLGNEEFVIAWTEGRSMTLQQVLTQIVSTPPETGSTEDGA